VLFLGDEGLILLCVVVLISIFFSPTGIEFYKTFSHKDLYLFLQLWEYIFVTNNDLVIGDWCEVQIALIGHFQISHVLASQTCWVDSVHFWISNTCLFTPSSMRGQNYNLAFSIVEWCVEFLTWHIRHCYWYFSLISRKLRQNTTGKLAGKWTTTFISHIQY
jgi:hypothetical protein